MRAEDAWGDAFNRVWAQSYAESTSGDLAIGGLGVSGPEVVYLAGIHAWREASKKLKAVKIMTAGNATFWWPPSANVEHSVAETDLVPIGFGSHIQVPFGHPIHKFKSSYSQYFPLSKAHGFVDIYALKVGEAICKDAK